MARRCYQRGQLWLRKGEWIARWYEVVVVDGARKRTRPQEVLGTIADYPTKPLAKRALAERIAHVNRIGYRPTPVAKFRDFAKGWETKVLSQFEPSTAINYKTHIRKYLIPFLGDLSMKDITGETVQQFVSSSPVSAKTTRNICITLQSVWSSAKAWGYVSNDVMSGVVLPPIRKPRQFFFTQQEVLKILLKAPEPYRTFYGLAAETGLRAGELCGLSTDDLDLDRRLLEVRQSAWRGKLGEPKTSESRRVVELSPQTCQQIKTYLLSWRPNEKRLLFASRNGTPWDQNLLLKRKFRPFLVEIGIKVPRGTGFHAFRHTSASLMNSFGASLKLRQQRLGHVDGSPVTESIYTHIISEDGTRVAAQLGAAIWGIPDANGHENKNGLEGQVSKPFPIN